MRTSFMSTKEKHEFQAETRKLLDIVTNSIYTDKEVNFSILFLFMYSFHQSVYFYFCIFYNNNSFSIV
jgi:hypothetical protein